MEYSKHKLRKFWRAEGRYRANDMGLQENFYFTCIYEILVYRKAAQETAKQLRFSNTGYESCMQRVQGDCRLAKEMRLSSAKNGRRYFKWHAL